MKNEQKTPELQSSMHESKSVAEQLQNKQPKEEEVPPIQDSGSVSGSSNDNKKVSRQDIELVQNLIERCLQLYMNRDEVVKTLLNRARIDPGFTTLVWQKLEEENADFFRAYYIRLKLKKQIIVFNHLLEHQYNLMKYSNNPPAQQQHSKVPLIPHHHHHPMAPVNNMPPMGYPVLPHHPQMAVGHHLPHHLPQHSMGCGMVKGVPAPANFQPMRMNSSGNNDMVIDTTMADPTPPMIPPTSNNNGISEMPPVVSPTSVASSSGHFPFPASDIISGMDTTFTSDVVTQLGDGGGGEAGSSRGDSSLRPFDQIPWNFSLSDLTADLSNLGDLGALGNYPGSPFLPSDSEILLDSPEQDDIDEFFVDSVPGPPCSQSDEDNKPFFVDSVPGPPCSQSDEDNKPSL